VLGVYIVVVYATCRLLRGWVLAHPVRLILAEAADVDGMLQLCLDIFLVREMRDFCLETDLYAKLLFLLRSPETLLRWTRLKKHR